MRYPSPNVPPSERKGLVSRLARRWSRPTRPEWLNVLDQEQAPAELRERVLAEARQAAATVCFRVLTGKGAVETVPR